MEREGKASKCLFTGRQQDLPRQRSGVLKELHPLSPTSAGVECRAWAVRGFHPLGLEAGVPVWLRLRFLSPSPLLQEQFDASEAHARAEQRRDTGQEGAGVLEVRPFPMATASSF